MAEIDGQLSLFTEVTLSTTVRRDGEEDSLTKQRWYYDHKGFPLGSIKVEYPHG